MNNTLHNSLDASLFDPALLPALSAADADAALHARPAPAVERLAAISADASLTGVSATFSGGVLSEFGDSLANNLTTSRDAAGTLRVNGGAVAVVGGTPTVANTTLVQVFGGNGNDTVTLDEANGALPRANLFGGSGNDVLVGGSGGDMLFGQADNDTLLGKGGNDFLFGGAGNDVLTGGDGDDQMFGEAGDDRFIWNPGDDTDLVEGGAGTDTVEVNGGNGTERFTLGSNGARVRIDRVDPAPFTIDAGTVEAIVINANGGDDTIDARNLLAAGPQLTLDGGTGNDTITGGQGSDKLLGGDGDDLVTGARGDDVALLGAGNDRFVWNPGDGNDTIEGQAGNDTLQFNGANVSENVSIAANGGRVRMLRDVAAVTMDLDDVETITFAALGGSDRIVVQDLSGTDVAQVGIDLAGAIGGTAGDAQADVVTARGGNGNDTIDVIGSGGSVAVVGLRSQVQLSHAETQDRLVIETLAGNDRIDASTLPAGTIGLTIDAGAGNDTVTGGQGADVLLGGDGNDGVTGGRGDDTAFLGAGDDVFVWNPGDGSDTVEGQAGSDTLRFNGANISENIDLSANGGRARLFRDVAAVAMDLDDVERIDIAALGGADNLTIGDLSGTDVTQVRIDLRLNGGADAQADSVTVNGGAGIETIVVANAGNEVTVSGLAAQTRLAGAEAIDRLTVNGGAGADTIDASAMQANAVQLTLNGGQGADVLIGSAGNDLVNGGDGNDLALMGAGDDVFVWNPGDDNDTIEGQAGNDTLLFNGANVAETIDISANGGRLRFSRNVAAVTMDLNDVETLDFNALGGADTITVGDLSGTDAKQINVDLAGAIGGTAGDAQTDTVVINGTNGDDRITLSLQNGALVVDGLATKVVVEHFDATDTIRILGLAGNDIVDATGLGAGGPQIVIDGGAGNDILQGGAGNDVLLGQAGDDILLGGPGADVLDGGAGENVVLQDAGLGVNPAAVATLVGDGTSNTLQFSRNAAGAILANGGAIALPGSPTVANTSLLRVFGLDGNDTLTLDEANGALPRAALYGGLGNDVIVAGSGVDQLFGEDGNDTLLGKGGADLLFGGEGDDVLTGGDGDDQMFGGAGNDRFIWNPGDDTDLVEGGTGTDTVEVNGGNGTERFTVSSNGARTRIDRVDPAPFSIDVGTSEAIVINANGGDDSINASALLAGGPQLTVDGGTGNDTIIGGQGSDLLLGGDGNDLVDGRRGDDVALLGAGDDVFTWNPGDGNDTIEGQAGTDTLLFNGSNANENIDISANGGRVRFVRDVAAVTMDQNDVERIEFHALGGADRIVVNDLSGTDARQIAIDLAGTIGGTAGDAQADSVTMKATNGDDAVVVTQVGGEMRVDGLTARLTIAHGEALNDRLTVQGLAGDDVIDASTLAAGALRVTLDGGAGNDVLLGGNGGAVLLGGAGDDVLIGGLGDDVLDGGAGDDVLIGGGGNDIFIGGEITINGFRAGAGSADAIDLRAFGQALSFDALLAHAHDLKGNAVLDLGNGKQLTLEGIEVASLHVDDFIFAPSDLPAVHGVAPIAEVTPS